MTLLILSLFLKDGNETYLFSKGAPERLLPRCSSVLKAQGIAVLTDEETHEIK